MLYEEKIKLLKALRPLKQIPERQIAALAEFLRPKELADEGVVFQEGSIGMSLYFVSSGAVRISKATPGGGAKDLAFLGPGEFFGEAALIEEQTRSATASAVGPSLLFELFRGDLSRWVKSNPQQAVQFFAELTNIQSMRLRRTTNELAMQSQLAELLLRSASDPKAFLGDVLERVVPFLEGKWSGGAFLYKDGAGLEAAAALGPAKLDEAAARAGSAPGSGSWLDDETFYVPLRGVEKAIGCLVFRAPGALGKDQKEETRRTLAAAAKLAAAALQSIG